MAAFWEPRLLRILYACAETVEGKKHTNYRTFSRRFSAQADVPNDEFDFG